MVNFCDRQSLIHAFAIFDNNGGKFLMRNLITRSKIFLLAFFFAISYKASATHLRAGEITVERLNCTSLTFRIIITVYTNTGSEIRFGDGVLDYGDGSQPHVTPTVQNQIRPELGNNVGYVFYSINHTFPGPGRYVIS